MCEPKLDGSAPTKNVREKEPIVLQIEESAKKLFDTSTPIRNTVAIISHTSLRYVSKVYHTHA
jgi:hypothetical protein